MNTTVIHPSTGPGAHAGVPSGDPGENIRAVRLAVRGVADLERELAEALTAARVRETRLTELGQELLRARETLADLVDQAYRLERENARLSADNRVLRDRLERVPVRFRLGRRRRRDRP